MTEADGLLCNRRSVSGLLRHAFFIASTEGSTCQPIYKTPGSGHQFVDVLTEAAWIIRQVDNLPTASLRNICYASYGCDATSRRRLVDMLVYRHSANDALAVFAVADVCGLGRQSERDMAEAAGLGRAEASRQYHRLVGVLDGLDAEASSALFSAFRDRGWI